MHFIALKPYELDPSYMIGVADMGTTEHGPAYLWLQTVNRSFVLRSRTAAQSVKQNFSSALYQLWARSAGPS